MSEGEEFGRLWRNLLWEIVNQSSLVVKETKQVCQGCQGNCFEAPSPEWWSQRELGFEESVMRLSLTFCDSWGGVCKAPWLLGQRFLAATQCLPKWAEAQGVPSCDSPGQVGVRAQALSPLFVLRASGWRAPTSRVG